MASSSTCPICKRVTKPDPKRPGPFPFCSDRCKLVDLGRWLDGRYQIPVEAADDFEVEPDEEGAR